MTNHDRMFKELLTTFFSDFVETFLPDVTAYLDLDSVVFLDKQIFTNVTNGEQHEVDLVVQGRFKGQDSFFLVHVEQQAQPQAEFGRRMFRYFARLHEKHGLPVYPVVVFSHDQRKLEADRYEDILDVLEARFGEAPYELRERILAVADETELKRLHRQAVLTDSLKAFQAKL
jgi:predicted transposase/invertase (TIGR01784 family)